MNLLIYDSLEGSDGINAHKFSIARQRHINLDNKISIMTKEGQRLTIQQFRVKRIQIDPPSIKGSRRSN